MRALSRQARAQHVHFIGTSRSRFDGQLRFTQKAMKKVQKARSFDAGPRTKDFHFSSVRGEHKNG